MLVRSSCLRASREARPHQPSNGPEARATVQAQVRLLEAQGLRRAPNPSVGAKSSPAASKAKASKRTSFEQSHILALHSRTVNGSHAESTWLSFQNTISLRHSALAFWALKAASVRISLVSEKNSPAATPKAGSSQQTTRVNSQPLVQTWSTQAAAVGIALGVARAQTEDPRGVGLSSPARILHAPVGSLHTTAATEVIVANAAPLRIAAFSFLEAVRDIAIAEIDTRLITRSVTHEGCAEDGAVRTLCKRASDLTQGDAVWACLALVLFLSHESHGRAILRHAGVADYDLAVARVLTDFGHSEVTRRFRLAEATQIAYRALPPPTESEIERVLRRVEEQSCDYESDSTAETVSVKRERGKRKRSPLQAPASLDIAADWAHALTSSGQIHVLLMLIASTAAAARSAADTTLQRQYSSNPNSLMLNVSKQQAVSSRESLRCLFRQPEDEAPRVVVWRTRDATGNTTEHRGIARSHEDLQRTMFCFGKTSRWSRPHLKIVNVSAYHVRCSDTVSSPLPGFCEASARVAEEEAAAKGKRDAERTDRLRGLRKGETTSSALTGISRAELVLAMRVVCSRSCVDAGERLAAAAKNAPVETKQKSPYEIATVLHDSPSGFAADEEPFATPSNNLAHGLQVSETLRVLHKGRDHRGDPNRAMYGPELHTGEAHEADVCEHDKPAPMVIIVDFEVEKTGAPEPVPSRPDACVLPVAVRLTVSGENPIRIAEAAVALEPAHAMALLLHAAAQVSLVNEEGRNVLAGAATAASASAKRILLADFRNLYLTVYQAFRVGHRNVKSSYPSCSWHGAYPAGVEMGSGGGLGKASVFLTADRRHHGKFLDTQELADEYSDAVAEQMTKQISDKHYDFTPPHARGIPHLAVPGLHSFLDDSVRAMEALRGVAKISGRTVDSIQVLPIGPFTENVAPSTTVDLDQTSNLPFRNQFDRLSTDGVSFTPDMTLDDVSVFAPPLVQRVGIRNSIDNPYGSAHEHLSSWFEAAALLSVFASVLLPAGSPRERVRHLRKAIETFHVGGGVQPENFYASRAVVLLSSMYPTTFEVGRESIELAYAAAAGPATKAFKTDSRSSLPDLVDAELLSDARAYWTNLNAGWSGLAPLLEELIRLDGTCDMTVTQLHAFRAHVDKAMRVAWFVSRHHDDQPRPFHPLAGLGGPDEITSVHVEPVFCAQPDGTLPRGALIGMKPGSFRSLVCLLLGAGQVAEVQVYRNEGGLLLRPSSAADIFDVNGKARTAKSCSPVGVEGDEAAYGTREAKLIGCKLQRAAWERNLRLLMPLCTQIALPLPADVRKRGGMEAQRALVGREKEIESSGSVSAERKEARLVAKIVLDALGA